jgi:flagellar biosynthesis protein FlhG
MLETPRLSLGRLAKYRRLLGLDKELADRDRPEARVICIASGKGGTGKTVVATNIAVQRAAMGERVLLVDFDAGLANAHLLLGVAPEYDLGHVLEGTVAAGDAIVEAPEGLALLSGGVGRHVLIDPTRRQLERLFRALRPLEAEFDLVIIDHGAGLGYATVAHLAATTTLLMVTNHEVTALSDSYAVYKRAHMVNPHIRVGLVMNRVPREEAACAAWERFRNASQRFLGHQPEWIGWVPTDEAVVRSIEARRPVTLLDPAAPASKSLSSVARWAPIDQARSARPFYERARAALK